jgi:hypothetical protein
MISRILIGVNPQCAVLDLSATGLSPNPCMHAVGTLGAQFNDVTSEYHRNARLSGIDEMQESEQQLPAAGSPIHDKDLTEWLLL